MSSLNNELGGLSAEVQYWKAEVKRMEAETLAQQKSDLESLETLTQLVEKIPAAQPAANTRR